MHLGDTPKMSLLGSGGGSDLHWCSHSAGFGLPYGEHLGPVRRNLHRKLPYGNLPKLRGTALSIGNALAKTMDTRIAIAAENA